jgi:hypothetical protein
VVRARRRASQEPGAVTELLLGRLLGARRGESRELASFPIVHH